MRFSCFLLFLFYVSGILAQDNAYEKGKIIDRVPVIGSDNETFQLYLPKAYDFNTSAAIVFIFDPSGNGTKGIRPFITSADRYNYILVCSNNSKNGPYQNNFDITNRLFSHIFSNFNIDERQIYTAGFSGGSRLASAIAVLTGAIQGVIACGAGFANEMDKKPSPASKFSYVGLVGDEDMNYQEMLNAKSWLDKFSVDNELFIYEDGHKWPPKEQIERAFDWLEMQAMKKGIRQADQGLINELYQKNLAIAYSLAKNHLVRAVEEYGRIVRNHSSNESTRSVLAILKTLRNSNDYQQELKLRETLSRQEESMSNKLIYRLNQEAGIGKSRDNFAWWKKEKIRLEEGFLNSGDILKEKMGKRILFRIKAIAYEGSMMQRNGRRKDKAIYCDKLLTQLFSEEPYWNYRLAETYAMNHDAKNARVNLQLALDKGFDDYRMILGNPEFKKLMNDKKFQAFYNKLKAN